jgi:maleylacetoacetate isomerase
VITLYRAPFSTNVERVAIALALKELAVDSVVISYTDRSPVVEVSGQGLVPVIVDDGEVVADSTRILRYLDERYPEPRLFPSDPARRAEIDIFVEWFNEVWKRVPNALADELEKAARDSARIDELSDRMKATLPLFEDLLDGHEHLFGELTAADLVAYPFLKYGAGRDPADDELFHRLLGEHLQLDGEYPRLRAWIDRIASLPQV